MNISDMPYKWAKEQALTEQEAFDWAVRNTNINEVDEKYEQAYRKGRADQLAEDEKLIIENAELRDMLKQQAEQINRLRETIRRRSDNEWD